LLWQIRAIRIYHQINFWFSQRWMGNENERLKWRNGNITYLNKQENGGGGNRYKLFTIHSTFTIHILF
jgi:hypothetical protein